MYSPFVLVLFILVKPGILDGVCGQIPPVANVPRICTTSDFAAVRRFPPCLYVDKTSFAYQIVSNPENVYFLSRPRMFGKSLFLSTLKYILEGREDLFKGLYIHDKWDWTSTYTVLRLDFSQLATENVAALKNSFINTFNGIARTQFKTKLLEQRGTDVCAYFENLVEVAEAAEPGNRLSLLIDEYDAPITNHLHNITKAKEMQTVLRDFFKCLKGKIGKFPLVYITGVTKFAKANLFSSLSHVVDLTRREEFNYVCGFTCQEIEKNMMGYLHASIKKEKGVDHQVTCEDEKKLLDEMALFYDGYHFLSKGGAVFSPSAITAYFRTHTHQEFAERTPHVKFVFNILPEYEHANFPINGQNVSVPCVETITELDDLKIEHILLDTGILTIKKYDEYTNKYFLHFPNEKVEEFTIKNLLPRLSKSVNFLGNLQGDTDELVRRLSILNRENAEEFFVQLRECIRKYTYFDDQPKIWKKSWKSQEKVKGLIEKLEFFYEFHVHIFLALGCRKAQCVATRQCTIESGRKDVNVQFSNQKLVIIELKVNEKPEINTTIAIVGTEQGTKYVQNGFARNDVITAIGLVFNSHSKTIENWIGITYNREGRRRTDFFSHGDLIKGELIPDPKFS